MVEPPRDTADPLIVIELLSKAEFGIFTRFAPDVADGSVTVPVKVGDSSGAFKPSAVVTVDAYEASSFIAAASSFKVFNVDGAVSTRFDTAVSTYD